MVKAMAIVKARVIIGVPLEESLCDLHYMVLARSGYGRLDVVESHGFKDYLVKRDSDEFLRVPLNPREDTNRNRCRNSSRTLKERT